MGSFFTKLAQYDPLAQALHLPGYNSYQRSQDLNKVRGMNGGAYAGRTPTLQDANGGYGEAAAAAAKPVMAPGMAGFNFSGVQRPMQQQPMQRPMPNPVQQPPARPITANAQQPLGSLF